MEGESNRKINSEKIDKIISGDFKLKKKSQDYLRKSFLKTLKSILYIKTAVEDSIKLKEMAEKTTMSSIKIPIFDGSNFTSWKFRIMTILEFNKCKEVAVREKASDENANTWKDNDLKAKTIVISAIADKQLEHIYSCETTLEIMKKLDGMYTNKSTALQIINRNKLERVKLENFEKTEDFFSEFEKACNEFKAAGGKIEEEEKIRYLINALPSSYSHIGDLIDLIPNEQRSVDLIKSKITEKSLNKTEKEGKPNASTFNAKVKGNCFICGKYGHFQADCWYGQKNESDKAAQPDEAEEDILIGEEEIPIEDSEALAEVQGDQAEAEVEAEVSPMKNRRRSRTTQQSYG